MRVLFLSPWHPYPPDNGSKLRIFNLLRGLTRVHDVTLIVLTDQPTPSAWPELAALCTDVRVVRRRPYRPTSARAMMGLLSRTPRVIVDTHLPTVAACIRSEVRSGRWDLVIASQLASAAYRSVYSEVPAIFEELELGGFEAKKAQARSPLHRLRHELPLRKLRSYLRRLLAQFSACTVVSDEELALLRRVAPGYSSAEIVPNGVSLAEYRQVAELPRPNTLIFTGSFRYRVNYDAMVWFLRQVYPRIRARIPSVGLTITGDHAGLPLPPAENVTLAGHLEDVRPFIASSWISLAPILVGGGTRLKILEAMALRTPVVATSKGAEGIAARHDHQVLIANTPEAFADEVVRLLSQPTLRRRLAENAYQLVCERYDWDLVIPRFLALAERVAHGRGVAHHAL